MPCCCDGCCSQGPVLPPRVCVWCACVCVVCAWCACVTSALPIPKPPSPRSPRPGWGPCPLVAHRPTALPSARRLSFAVTRVRSRVLPARHWAPEPRAVSSLPSCWPCRLWGVDGPWPLGSGPCRQGWGVRAWVSGPLCKEALSPLAAVLVPNDRRVASPGPGTMGTVGRGRLGGQEGLRAV